MIKMPTADNVASEIQRFVQKLYKHFEVTVKLKADNASWWHFEIILTDAQETTKFSTDFTISKPVLPKDELHGTK